MLSLPSSLQLPLRRLRDHAAPRRWLVLGLGFIALCARCAAPAPPARTVEGIAAMLAQSVGGEVRADDFVWEERGGVVGDALFGRRVLFLARTSGGTRDLYRARVRLTRTGRAVAVGGLRNLTDTPLGDDGDLVARGRHVAFATRASGSVQGITLLDLGGEGSAREARTAGERWRSRLESWLDVGTRDGIGRTEITFGVPPADARLEMRADSLVMALGADAVPAALAFDGDALNAGPRNGYDAVARTRPHPVRPLVELSGELARVAIGERAGRATVSAFARGRDLAARSRRMLRPRPFRPQSHRRSPTKGSGWRPGPGGFRHRPRARRPISARPASGRTPPRRLRWCDS